MPAKLIMKNKLKQFFQEGNESNELPAIHLSIYMPTRPQKNTPFKMRERMQFLQLLVKIENKLFRRGACIEFIKTLMKPAYELTDNKSFWHDLNSGLAIFISNTTWLVYKLEFVTPLVIYIDDHHMLQPLNAVGVRTKMEDWQKMEDKINLDVIGNIEILNDLITLLNAQFSFIPSMEN